VAALAGISHAGSIASPSSDASLGDCSRHFRSIDVNPILG
jgi:hypothetical protein